MPRLYLLMMRGAQGRVAVRGWIESTVERVSRDLAQHFADAFVLRNTPRPKDRELPAQIALRHLLAALTPKKGAVPGPLVCQVIEAMFKGTAYPISLLQQALMREQAEIGKTGWLDWARRDARAAVIKAVLNRRRRIHQATTEYQEIAPALDPTNTSQGYTLGCLLGVLERIRQQAIGDGPLLRRSFRRA